MSAVCEECHSYKVFGEKCWFFWGSKKSCSQFRGQPLEEPKFRSVDVPLSMLR